MFGSKVYECLKEDKECREDEQSTWYLLKNFHKQLRAIITLGKSGEKLDGIFETFQELKYINHNENDEDEIKNAFDTVKAQFELVEILCKLQSKDLSVNDSNIKEIIKRSRNSKEIYFELLSIFEMLADHFMFTNNFDLARIFIRLNNENNLIYKNHFSTDRVLNYKEMKTLNYLEFYTLHCELTYLTTFFEQSTNKNERTKEGQEVVISSLGTNLYLNKLFLKNFRSLKKRMIHRLQRQFYQFKNY